MAAFGGAIAAKPAGIQQAGRNTTQTAGCLWCYGGGGSIAARRHRGDGGVVSRARGNGSAMRLACSRSEHLAVVTASRCRATFAELTGNAILALNCNRIGSKPRSMSEGHPGQYARVCAARASAASSRLEPLPALCRSASAAPPRTCCGNAGCARWAIPMEPFDQRRRQRGRQQFRLCRCWETTSGRLSTSQPGANRCRYRLTLVADEAAHENETKTQGA